MEPEWGKVVVLENTGAQSAMEIVWERFPAGALGDCRIPEKNSTSMFREEPYPFEMVVVFQNHIWATSPAQDWL